LRMHFQIYGERIAAGPGALPSHRRLAGAKPDSVGTDSATIAGAQENAEYAPASRTQTPAPNQINAMRK